MSTLDGVLLALRFFIAALLYAFLIAVTWILWQDLRRAAWKDRPRPAGRLVVVEVGETDLEVGTAFPLHEVTSLGRAPSNKVPLADPYVSAHHALLSWRDGHWWVEDLGSRNGTTLNGESITRPTVVSTGDLIGVGRVILRLEVSEE